MHGYSCMNLFTLLKHMHLMVLQPFQNFPSDHSGTLQSKLRFLHSICSNLTFKPEKNGKQRGAGDSQVLSMVDPN